ncbi:HlyU family transcriptional regulator [Jannaschia sp. LMIT008]|uniref:HlyU family transcriptional regulator n=1 Tax=Jannaschia maritima TaxID=3032585 RepID=UPI002811650B|nr:HlyU family transcriptional regulator [Jannaschia sp. LMIT008]
MAGFLSKLFGGAGAAKPKAPAFDPVEYEGFTITPAPEPQPGGHRIGAVIEKDGKSHHLIRADVISGRDACVDASVSKAKQMIDEQGDGIFR